MSIAGIITLGRSSLRRRKHKRKHKQPRHKYKHKHKLSYVPMLTFSQDIVDIGAR